MSLQVNFNYQGQSYEIRLEETNQSSEKVVTVNGKDYKIIGNQESISIVKTILMTSHNITFDNVASFKASLEQIGPIDKVKTFATDSTSGLLLRNAMGAEVESKLAVMEENGKLRENIDAFLENAVKTKNFRGSVLVVNKGNVVIKQGYGQEGITDQTTFHIASITKSFTASLILELHQNKRLDVNDPINKHLPEELRNEKWKDIQIKHLLNHSSGIPNSGPDPGEEQRNYTPQDVIDTFKDKDLDFEPGSKIAYCNSGYILLGSIIENVYSKPIAQCLQERIFDRYGMHSTGFGNTYDATKAAQGYVVKSNEGGKDALIPVKNQGSYLSKAHSGGAIYSTIDDLQKFDAALHDDSFLKPETRELMFQPTYLKGNVGPIMMGLGFKIWNDEKLGLIVSKEGGIPGFSTVMQRYINSKSCIIVLSNNGDINAERDIALEIEKML